MNTRIKPGLNAKTLGKVLKRGAEADARGATQVLGRGGQAAARRSYIFLSQVIGRGAEAYISGVPWPK